MRYEIRDGLGTLRAFEEAESGTDALASYAVDHGTTIIKLLAAGWSAKERQ